MNIRNVQAVKMILLAAAVVSNCMGSLGAKSRPEYTKIDQPFVFFKAIKGGKYPWMIKCHPGINQWETVLCGTEENGQARVLKNTADLAFLSPLSHSMKWADSGLELRKEFSGYREAYGAIALEVMFKTIGLMPDSQYKGTLLVDEYVQGLPMKFVLADNEHFKALKAYLLNHFSHRGIQPTDATELKPALFIEILDGSSLDSDDRSFLDSYFDVIDAQDQNAKAFFEGAQKTLNDALDKTKDSKLIGEKVGEVLLRSMEKGMGKFEAEKMLIMGVSFVVGGVVVKYVTDYISGKVKGGLDSVFRPRAGA